MKQQTAVEWLHDKWSNCKEWKWEEIEQWFEQAKQMEKDQMEEAYCQGCKDITENDEIFPRITAEEYYNKIYKK